jgi:sarcosine oxidase subunit gamma
MLSDANNSAPRLGQGANLGAVLRDMDQPVAVELVGEKSRYSLRVREADVPAFSEATGLSLPIQVGLAHITDDQIIMCLSPDEWLIIASPDSKAQVMKKCDRNKASPHSLVDVSHRNIAFRISGEGAAQLINVGCPLDLDLAAFPEGKCTRTIFERAEIVLMREAETVFHIEIWRSFAPYFMSLLTNGGQSQ